ncbi:SlyX protein [Sphaerotilus sulfidivorans]|uniref:SlyX family protein n=1 Tax=Sphaerotilus sulfidivorans TaxID=639200 RepID=A0A5C1PVG0_9BURK|nr:SlyX family protein [Sphaerotilus sulfidivorans]NZD46117.1 SlyX family protein [Sphaerotilus sulfidivorans]QEM99416.1 SlyX family protein [Sphaerotilus sulfidivorans]
MTIDSSRAESASAAQACGLSVPDTDTRLTELEIKASYADDLLDHLNEVVARQQQIDLLVREVARLNRQLGENAAASGGAGARDPRDEIPPHW